ncbi:hypothetical protein Dimus_029286 [Dionaea muscipula]
MATPSQSSSQIPKNTPLICPIPLVVDKSSQRTVNLPFGDMTVDEDVVILGEKKGEQPKRRSRRIAETWLNQTEDSDVPIFEWVKKPEREEKVEDATQPMMTDYFKESFLNMCELKRENGIWWLDTGENRRRDEEEGDQEEDSEEDENESKEKEQDDSPGESTPTATEGERS